MGCHFSSRGLSGLRDWARVSCVACIAGGFFISWVTRLAQDRSAAAAKSLQLCPTLCDPIDGSPPGSPVPGILQASTLEWVAISFSNAWKRKVKGKLLSRVWLLPTPWTAAYQAPPSMGFSRQEYWSGAPLLSPQDRSGLLLFSVSMEGGVETCPFVLRWATWKWNVFASVHISLTITWPHQVRRKSGKCVPG